LLAAVPGEEAGGAPHPAAVREVQGGGESNLRRALRRALVTALTCTVTSSSSPSPSQRYAHSDDIEDCSMSAAATAKVLDTMPRVTTLHGVLRRSCADPATVGLASCEWLPSLSQPAERPSAMISAATRPTTIHRAGLPQLPLLPRMRPASPTPYATIPIGASLHDGTFGRCPQGCTSSGDGPGHLGRIRFFRSRRHPPAGSPTPISR